MMIHPHIRSLVHAATLVLAALALIVSSTLATGCSSSPSPRPVVVEPIQRDIPDVLRGTVGSTVTIQGIDPTLVSGFGFVVGLAGTGGGELDVTIQQTMEQILARNGLGRGGAIDQGPLAGKSVEQILRDPNTAVVIVEAVIPPGTPEGYTFDVHVRTLPGSSVTSLEGGTLYTTDLRIGPPAVFGARQTRKLAEAHGPVFINPFAEPGQGGTSGAVLKTRGRVIGGGLMTDALKLALVLDAGSYARARSIVNSVNSRFPRDPVDREPTARGRDAESIAINIPSRYADDPQEFVELLTHLRIDNSYAQEWANRYVQAMKRQPGMAAEISWCLQAIGKSSLPFVATMYDYPELLPRLGAIEAGAKLGDQRTVPHLAELALEGPPGIRTRAIELMAELPLNPQINDTLLELVNHSDLEVRIAAYESLAARGDPRLDRYNIDSKFILDRVPSYDPLIYVSLSKQPKVVLFGDAPSLEKPSLVSAWSDRLMIVAPTTDGPARLRYTDYITGTVTTNDKLPADLIKLIDYLAHDPSPEEPRPGLDLSYSEVVGALYEMHQQEAVTAAFATETDRIWAQIFEASSQALLADRPESSSSQAPDAADRAFSAVADDQPRPDASAEPEDDQWRPRVVPIAPAATESENR